MNKVWDRLTKDADDAGYACYAQRQAQMYARLADDCKSRWEEVAESQ